MSGARDVLARARSLVEQPDAATAGLWPRAAALLARQALEQALRDVWARRAPSVARLSGRAQLTCLAQYVRDPALAGEVAYTWSALSDACHQRAYDTGPTAAELGDRFAVVERLIDRLAATTVREPSADPT